MRIVIRQSDQKWRVVESALYKDEEQLQKLLAEAPELIPMNEFRPLAGEVRLVVSEFGVPGSGYLDLLGFTATGDIVLMECKLRSNPEIKRKVVGQLFEYAGFLWRMTFEQLDAGVRQRRGDGLLNLMGKVVQKDWNPEAFRQRVEQNLATGAFVLAIVVDRATDELQRAAMFISECGKSNFSFHVLEMQRFQAGDTEILTPHVHGTVGTTSTEAQKGRLSKEQFLEQVYRVAPEHAPIAENLYQFAESEADNLGGGRDSFSFRVVNSAGKGTTIFLVYTAGRLEIGIQAVRERAGEAVAQQFLESLREFPSFAVISSDAKYPVVWLQQGLPNEKALEVFKQAVLRVKAALAADGTSPTAHLSR